VRTKVENGVEDWRKVIRTRVGKGVHDSLSRHKEVQELFAKCNQDGFALKKKRTSYIPERERVPL
jgi:hypothetical protein